MAEDKANQKPKYRFSAEKLNQYMPSNLNDKQAEEYVLKAYPTIRNTLIENQFVRIIKSSKTQSLLFINLIWHIYSELFPPRV